VGQLRLAKTTVADGECNPLAAGRFSAKEVVQSGSCLSDCQVSIRVKSMLVRLRRRLPLSDWTWILATFQPQHMFGSGWAPNEMIPRHRTAPSAPILAVSARLVLVPRLGRCGAEYQVVRRGGNWPGIASSGLPAMCVRPANSSDITCSLVYGPRSRGMQSQVHSHRECCV